LQFHFIAATLQVRWLQFIKEMRKHLGKKSVPFWVIPQPTLNFNYKSSYKERNKLL